MIEEEIKVANPLDPKQEFVIQKRHLQALTEKPLHVQVAEALGCKPELLTLHAGPPIWSCPCAGASHGLKPDELSDEYGNDSTIARYDTDWSATGPLIEKYELALGQTGMDDPKPTWVAWWPGSCDVDTCSVDAPADTPLLAACHLLLSLKAAGKL